MIRPFPPVAAAAAAVACAAVLAVPAAAPASGAPSASAARACSVTGIERKLGPTYVTALSVRHASCATGKRLVRAYYRCRLRHGGKKGHCSRALGFRCRESRHGIATEFDATVRCRKGRARVMHKYTQFT